ncbi:alcohol dehydrogenase catalytic domain-containing protein, partial [Amnibacterium sp.]|uniref:alcohol dehydrogenase catalytic domain-containing protein n=1 Tax=Amnibacterium sp. TaxID=1872496 RepID=UPI00262995EF
MHYLLATERGAVETRTGESAPLPQDHVRVEVAFVGICHSDIARVREGQGAFPARIGHEVSGTVTESACGIPVGSRVVAYVEDGYATELIVPAARIVRLHDDCSLLDGALAEPLACVIGGIEMLDLATPPEVALVGAGFMGLMALRVLVARGIPVTVIEPRERSRSIADAWGAARTLAPEAVPETMRQNVPVVVEATGGAGGLKLASDLVQIAGTLGIMGYHQSNGGTRTVEMESWNFRALRVLSLHHRDPDDVLRWIDRAQRLAANGILRPSELVDVTVGFEGLPQVFA